MKPVATLAVVLALGGLAGCPGSAPPPPRPGPACRALLSVAERGRGCDDTLGALADRLAREPDEAACIRATRNLLATPPASTSQVRSLHAADDTTPDDAPLRPEELDALAALELPAPLSITPDIRAVPGLPPTHAMIDGVALTLDEQGRLQASTAAGARTLTLRHAGKQTEYCVELTACEPLQLTSHAARLAKHERVHLGRCPG